MRILTPLKNIEGQFSPISFEEAFQQISLHFKQAIPEKTAVLASGKLSNEELYLIQKLARIGIKTNALASFEYLEKKDIFCFDKNDIVPLAELSGTTQCYCLGFNQSDTHPQLDLIRKIAEKNSIPISYLTEQYGLKDSCSFFKAVNLYIVRQHLTRGIFVERLAKNLDDYLNSLHLYSLDALLQQAQINEEQLKQFINSFLNTTCPVIIYYEPNTSVETIKELNNLALLTGIQAQQSSGLLGIKENINSQGLFDMGIFSNLNVGGDAFNDDNLQTACQIYGCKPVHTPVDVLKLMENGYFKTYFLFQEDSFYTLKNKELIEKALQSSYVIQQTDCLNKTSKLANLILPASMPTEGEGTYTDSTRTAFKIKNEEDCKIEMTNFEQITKLFQLFGLVKPTSVTDVFFEYISFFKTGCRSAQRHYFKF